MTGSADDRAKLPIRASDRVSDVLARSEALVDVFARHAPHFEKLRNRALRRVMARLVTVQQAADVAGVPVAALLRDLNATLGIESSAAPAETVAPRQPGPRYEPVRHPADAAVVEVDVREDLRAGREPFSSIMAAVGALAPGDVLHLRTIFEPVPLYAVMAKRGFAHETAAHASDDWSVWFWRGDAPVAREPRGAAAAVSEPESAAPTDHWLDVRGLEPPEPMLRTLAALETLPPGHTLVQHNVRVPQFLLPMLVERGFTFTLDESRPDRVLVRIRHAAATQDRQPTTEESPMSSSLVELDVRVIPPREKHPTIFRTFDSLARGSAMLLINDHDPRPLRYQLLAERPDSFEWTYLEEGPEVWRVKIDRK